MDRYPARDDRGGHLGERHWSQAPNRDHIHRTIGNVTIINHIHGRVGAPNLVRGRHYWYYDNGMRRSHYYDHNGLHWFGFYLGDVYFWTRWHNNRLWWNDAGRGRWLYHDAGYWWWVNGGVVFIYRDGAYHRWQSSRGGYRAEPETPAEEKVEFYSEDGSRLVRVYGDKKEGFLYDNTPEEPAYLAYLGSNVEDVQFAAQEGGMNILVTAKDEQGAEVVRLYTQDGQETGPQDSVSPEGQLKDSPAYTDLQGQAPQR